MMPGLCPCGSGRELAACCGPYLAQTALPASAEALMRSRYTAFAMQNWDYLRRTELRPDDDAPLADIEWLGLDILATDGGGEGDSEGTVEFVAHYRHGGKPGALREKSRFRRREGRWFYLDGEVPAPVRSAKVGRNDPCPCGSGRKFKKCCAGG